MKKHLLNKQHWKNARVPDERWENISMCGKEFNEWEITETIKEVTCKSCLRIINKNKLI